MPGVYDSVFGLSSSTSRAVTRKRSDQLTALYDPETAVESALARLAGELGFNQVSRPRANTDQETARCEVQCMLGAATGHRRPIEGETHTGNLPHDAWAFRLMIAVVTDRGDDRADARHAGFRAKLRAALATPGLLNARLPHHYIADLRPEATTTGVVQRQDVDSSQLPFAGTIYIRPDAWPS